MAQHKSAAKRARQGEDRRQRNMAVKTRVRGATKLVHQSIAAGQADEAAENLKLAAKIINTAVSKGVIHQRNGARKISRLSKKVATLSREA